MHKGKKFNLPIKIVSVRFSPTNRSWAAATTEGIYIYSLDCSLVFSPLILDIDVTPENCLTAFKENNFIKAIVYAIYLNKADLINEFINCIPLENIILISSKLPFNAVASLLNFLSKKLENDINIQISLIWVLNLIKFHGANLKNKKNKNIFLNLNKSINKHYLGLMNLLEENKFTINFINEKVNLEKGDDTIIIDN